MDQMINILISNKANVLFVDDETDFAKVYIPLWKRKTGLEFTYAKDAQTAIETVRQQQIKVVILDYLMPTSGFELRRKLLTEDPKLKMVLLTGEIADHLTQAPREGFDFTLIKNERDLNLLPDVVISLLQQYDAEMRQQDCSQIEVFYAPKKASHIFRLRHKIKYSIIDYATIAEEQVVGDWHTNVFLQEGQELSSEAEFNIEREFQFTNDFKIENESSLSISQDKLLSLKTNLAMKFEEKSGTKYTEKIKEVFKKTSKYSLQDDSHEIVSRSYDYAKMAKVLRIYLKEECSCCERITVVPITVYLPIPAIKYRMVEHYRDNSKKEIDLGEVR